MYQMFLFIFSFLIYLAIKDNGFRFDFIGGLIFIIIFILIAVVLAKDEDV